MELFGLRPPGTGGGDTVFVGPVLTADAYQESSADLTMAATASVDVHVLSVDLIETMTAHAAAETLETDTC